MLSVAMATCEQYPLLFPDDQKLLPALAAQGMRGNPVVWTDPQIEWKQFDAVVVRSIWDYQERLEEFVAWLDDLQTAGVRVFNPVSVLKENFDKTYLQTLSSQGIEILPTLWCRKANIQEIFRKLGALGWGEIVIKPSIAAGAFRTIRTHVDNWERDQGLLATIFEQSQALIQPYDAGIEFEGEWSIIFMGDTYSHSVLKKPRNGDFRVQFVHGGSHHKAEPSADLLKAARNIHKTSQHPLLYSRIDGIWRGGRFILMEWEKLEPFLFLAEHEPAATLFVAELRRQLVD